MSGKLCDATGKHWVFITLGYGLLIVVPILCALFLAERIGKALRSPAKDAVVSRIAENRMGTGIVFGLLEALDQIGAFIGPAVFTVTFAS